MIHRRFSSLVGLSSLLVWPVFGCASDDDPVQQQVTNGGTSSAPNSGLAGGGEGGAAGSAAVAECLIDDFEDGDGRSLSNFAWSSFDDRGSNGSSTIEFPNATAGTVEMTGEGYESTYSLWVRYTFDQGKGSTLPYVGFGVWVGSSCDATKFGSIRYVYKGGAHSIHIETWLVTDFDQFQYAVPASDEWAVVTIPFTLFTQQGWGKPVDFDLTTVTKVSFEMFGDTGESGELRVDNLAFYGEPQTAVKVKDLQLLDAAPPTKTVLDSLTIANPLQQKAMQYLNRGTNLPWLEQSTFTGFTSYDETFVANLAAAGFKGLRLPVDLDRYADASGVANADLFTVLDAFDAWTSKYGLSLTIDYHAYDNSISLTNTATQDLAVSLWGQVAEHFAGNTREDLFFELLNEPELSMGVDAVPQTTWTALAERMIAAIRNQDATHTILFGDVDWYGIDELAARQPLSDNNVIYVFHDYDPLIFTHQGASWTGMSSIHDVPFPYDVTRWSEYSSDFGVNASTESWVLQSLQYYFRYGTYNALFNRVAIAKKWAVMNNVAVICNEFGAYDTRSRLEDRVRYYEAIIGVFEELEIPWQHWYMIMDPKTGVVNPAEYKTPFGLTR